VRSRRAYALLAGSFIASCVVCGAAGAISAEPGLITYGPLFGLAAAYGYVAWKDRSRSFAAWTLVILAGATVAIALDAGHPARTIALVVGARLILDGYGERKRLAVA
jgi:hypothetical protein